MRPPKPYRKSKKRSSDKLLDLSRKAGSIDLLTLLQLPLIEVGNAVRADYYSIASYP